MLEPFLGHAQGGNVVSSVVARVTLGSPGLVASEEPRQTVPQEVINSVQKPGQA